MKILELNLNIQLTMEGIIFDFSSSFYIHNYVKYLWIFVISIFKTFFQFLKTRAKKKKIISELSFEFLLLKTII